MTQLRMTMHFWPGFPISWTVMKRPVGDTGASARAVAPCPSASPAQPNDLNRLLLHFDLTMPNGYYGRTRGIRGPSPPGKRAVYDAFIGRVGTVHQSEFNGGRNPKENTGTEMAGTARWANLAAGP